MNLRKHLPSIAQTGAFLLAMILLMGFMGWVIAGRTGFILAGLAGAFLLMFRPNLPVRLTMRWFRGRQLSAYEAPGLIRAVHKLAGRAGLDHVPRLFLIPRRDANAFAVGGGDESAIGVTQGLLNGLSQRELTGVLAHEIGHIASGDLRVMALASTVNQVTRFFCTLGQILLLLNIPYFLMTGHGVPWLLVLLLLAAPVLSILLQLGLSRTREFHADAMAARLTGDPKGLASALLKLDRHKFSLWSMLFFPHRRPDEPSWLRSHPKTAQRVEKLMSRSRSDLDTVLMRPNTRTTLDDVYVRSVDRRYGRPVRIFVRSF